MPEPALLFQPHLVQQGLGPHLGDPVYAYDRQGHTFFSDIRITPQGLRISDTGGRREFGIVVRWNVEGYGYLKLFADNGGRFYTLPRRGEVRLSLNLELARSRIARNRHRAEPVEDGDWRPSPELQACQALADQYLEAALLKSADPQAGARAAQKALLYGLWESELLELEIARHRIRRQKSRPEFLFGCDTRGYFQMDPGLFFERYQELFNYGTITHYLKGDAVDFESREGRKQFAERDRLLDELLRRGITVEGRPLFWTHVWVTPDWLRKKSFSGVLRYLEKHVTTVLKHYGDRIGIWEVVNELHDWANELELDPAQSLEITRLTCEVARAVNPRVRLLINNCCPFAEYVQTRKWTERPARYPQRTPIRFLEEVQAAGIDYDIIGAQMYFTGYPPADCLQILERYEQFGKPLQIAEVGSPSRGITQEFIEPDIPDPETRPYEWHRHWDEELQADWLETVFTWAYSRPLVEGANWYDLMDPHTFLKHGGILRSSGTKKAAAFRLQHLRRQWGSLPTGVTDR